MSQAACKGLTELFFPPAGEREEARLNRERRARAVCTSCPSVIACREFARRFHELGFWGGENEDQRRAARRAARRLAS
jgi:WhiB family transcriptional regulator, redox-sensing transcriptional regulator